MKIFIDTNIWIRTFVDEKKTQNENCKELLEKIEEGLVNAYTSSIVLLEFYYVLEKVYDVSRKDISNYVKHILEIRNIVVEETTNISKALELHSRSNVKISDCIIVTQISEKVILCTYDKEMKKIHKATSTPEEVISSL